MKCFFALSLLLFNVFAVSAQVNIKIVVEQIATKSKDEMYITGSFNNWNPKDENYKLKPYGGDRKMIILKNVQPGNYAFKFTRGSWQKVETNADGTDKSNREFYILKDTTINITIAGWKDDFPDKPKPNTATKQVQIIDTAFAIPQLNDTRRIWIYLPKDYKTSKEKYPVLYMHDGQNLFNEQTAPFGEWGVDEALDTLQKQNKNCIVVGIDCDEKNRINEYTFYDHKEYGKAMGKEYVDFLIKTLKPYIDKTYRTKTDAANTYIAGSSMGGLISFLAATSHPETFSAAGIFSPSFWIAPQVYTDIKNKDFTKSKISYFFYAGGAEGKTMVDDAKRMADMIDAKPHAYKRVTVLVNPPGKHNEAEWRKQFPVFYNWLFGK